MLATVYYTARCMNCTRFLQALGRSPSARSSVAVVDIDQTPVRGIQYVPTVVLNTGEMYVGTKAFEWLRQHTTDAVLEAAPDSGCGLAFSELQGDGYAQYSSGFSTFTRPM
jgi:hypothetical protein